MPRNPKYAELHPRLYFDPSFIQDLRLKIQSNPDIGEKWSELQQQADRLLTAEWIDESYADALDSQHGNYGEPSGQVSQMGMILGLAYQVTGNPKYAEKLRDALLFYSNYKKWIGKALERRNPPWTSELNTARFCYGFGVGFDCIYDFLTPEERTIICDSVVRLGILPTLNDWILPEKRIHAMDTMGHNWWSVCVSQAGIAALSILGDEPRAEEWLEDIVRAFPHYFAYKGSVLGNKSPNYDEKGAFYESVVYAEYGLSEYLMFRLAYQNAYEVFALSDIPMLARMGEFFIQTAYPTADQCLTVSFGDGYLNRTAEQSARLLLANGYEDPKLRWYLQCVKPELHALDLLYHDKIWGGASLPPDVDQSAEIYEEIGWVVLRNCWEKDATLLAAKSGFTWNHAHADAGSFMLFHQGQPLLIDSGTCAYRRKEYREYYCQSKAHNVVLFNGHAQNTEDLSRGVKEPGKLYNLLQHHGLRYVYADATGPTSRYFSRNFRHFLWVENVILVIDDLRAYEAGIFSWLLHYNGEAQKQSNGGFRIANGRASVLVHHLMPQNLQVREMEGLAEYDADRKVSYYSLDTAEANRNAKFVTAIIPQQESSEDQAPEIDAWQEEDTFHIRLIQQGKQTDVYLKLHDVGQIMCVHDHQDLWETDAYLFAVTRAVNLEEDTMNLPERFFISYGSYLRRNGQVSFTSLSKATTAFSMENQILHISLRGQPYIEAEFYTPSKPAKVNLNGGVVDWRFNQKKRVEVSWHHSQSRGQRPG